MLRPSVVKQGMEWRRQNGCKSSRRAWVVGSTYIGGIVNQVILVGGLLHRPSSCAYWVMALVMMSLGEIFQANFMFALQNV